MTDSGAADGLRMTAGCVSSQLTCRFLARAVGEGVGFSSDLV